MSHKVQYASSMYGKWVVGTYSEGETLIVRWTKRPGKIIKTNLVQQLSYSTKISSKFSKTNN